MKCKMCYVFQNKEEMNSKGRMLTAKQWIEILNQAKDNGVLYLLITGGEPLLYPEFKELYSTLIKMGFIVSLNTNGTLINEEWVDFFVKNPCKRLNITLYGKDNETYGKLCRNPKGFSQVIKTAKLLKSNKIPFTFTSSLTKLNSNQLSDLMQIARDFNVPYNPASYMFPTTRRNVNVESQSRLSPEEAAKTTFKYYKLSKSNEEMQNFVRSTLANLFLPPRISIANGNGYTCRGGKSGFWMNWKGEMTSCAMLEEPSISLLNHSFKECWDYIVNNTKNLHYCNDCVQCTKQNICHICPATLFTETGSFVERPDYLCKYTDELIKQLIEYLPSNERQVYISAVKNGGMKQVL